MTVEFFKGIFILKRELARALWASNWTLAKQEQLPCAHDGSDILPQDQPWVWKAETRMAPTSDGSLVHLSCRMRAFGSWMCFICAHRRRRTLGKLGDFHAFEGLQVGWGRFSYLWARSPGLLLLPNVLTEASRLSGRAPSAALTSPSVPSWGVLAEHAFLSGEETYLSNLYWRAICSICCVHWM